MEGQEEYTYTRIDFPDNIRLARLFAGHDTQLEIDLVEQNPVQAGGTYIALSYACGDTSHAIRKAVICDERVIKIYPTLYSALLKLRHTSKSTLVWCDGLCIDQGQQPDSLTERSQQIQLMFEIYSNARTVVVDLGDDLGPSQNDFIRTLHSLAALSTKKWSSVAPYTYEYSFYDGDDKFQSAEEGTEVASEPQHDSHNLQSFMEILPVAIREKWLWEAFVGLVSRPYFKRLWVLQEHALAREVFFMLGESEIQGHLFSRAVNRLSNIYNAFSTERNEIYNALVGINLPKFDCINKLFKTRHFRDSKNSWNTPAILIYETIGFNCFDQRDKLYGLLGLCRPEDRRNPDLRVDYQESLEHFELRISRYLLSQTAPFVLYRSIGCPHHYGTPRPSWVIDLTMRENNHLSDLVSVDGTCSLELYDASQDSRSTTVFQASLPPNEVSAQLMLSARLLPALKSVSVVLPQETDESPDKIAHLSTWLRNLSEWASEHFSSTTSRELNASAILATATADTFWEMGRWHRASRWSHSPQLGRINAAFRKWLDYISGSRVIDEEFAKAGEEAVPMAVALVFAYGRRLAVALMGGQGLLSLVPESTQTADVIAVVTGLPLPLVLRPCSLLETQQVKSAFRLVGSAYVHGMMDGLAFNEAFPEQQITLV